MAHEKVFGHCENLCNVEVDAKSRTDAKFQELTTAVGTKLNTSESATIWKHDNGSTQISMSGDLTTFGNWLKANISVNKWITGKVSPTDTTGYFGGNLFSFMANMSSTNYGAAILICHESAKAPIVIGQLRNGTWSWLPMQKETDNGFATTAKTVVGAVNEVRTTANAKQNASDNSLATNVKTVVGGINELKSVSDGHTSTLSTIGNQVSGLLTDVGKLNSHLNVMSSHVISANNMADFELAIYSEFTSMSNETTRICKTSPSFYEQYFKGYAQPAILYRRTNNAFQIYFPVVGMSGYYYDDDWHWEKETRTSVNPQ